MQQITFNRSMWLGLLIALLTAATALAGAPASFAGFRVPIWELLFQFNLCSGFLFLLWGVLESVEMPLPDFGPAPRLLAGSFVAYALPCAGIGLGLALPFAYQLFLFTLSLACLGAGWAYLAVAFFRALDAAE